MSRQILHAPYAEAADFFRGLGFVQRYLRRAEGQMTSLAPCPPSFRLQQDTRRVAVLPAVVIGKVFKHRSNGDRSGRGGVPDARGKIFKCLHRGGLWTFLIGRQLWYAGCLREGRSAADGSVLDNPHYSLIPLRREPP
jgi:hypothetical protein